MNIDPYDDERARLRAAIIEVLREQGPCWTYVLRNWLTMRDRNGGPAPFTSLSTSQVRRECERMMRDGLLERLPTFSALYINWGLKASPLQTGE
ncbi:hypothetical protein [Telmatospirillum sp. J64-1]|uniref:hypothetical protein n=1 Tax=Telmatospirillum sp. J64-1 TaxID=2502183 RepID=UPI00115EE0D4|nr:hypothetical protein [Telmatospirillum sp. J64-1]